MSGESSVPAAEELPRIALTLPTGAALSVELARTPAARERGLMFRRKLDADYGMLFVFEREQPLLFWMKNTFVDLDMVFLDKERRITGIAREVPKSKEDTPESAVARRGGFGLFVLELPAGAARRYGLDKGQVLGFSLHSNE